MESSLNQTQSTPQTSNPQDAVPSEGASNSADFQSTAPEEALRQQTEALSVQETGDPVSGSTTAALDNSFSIAILFIIGLLIAGAVIFYKLMKETVEESAQPQSKPAATKKSSTTKKTPAKKPASKKTPSGKPRKKSTRKKR